MMNQNDEVLNYLRTGYSLTGLEALDKFDHSQAEGFIKNWAKPYLKKH